jgi:hypothetical protein
MFFEIDCHGMTTKEVYSLLKDIEKDETIKKVKLITGSGMHSKQRPQMDYMCSKEWKCPIKQVILDFIIYEQKQGARMNEYPTYILWNICR